jgi:hypothetical protein
VAARAPPPSLDQREQCLIEDARRDWQALGGIALDIQPLSKIKPEAKIRQADGILFASYATLRSGTGEKTRLQQLLNG